MMGKTGKTSINRRPFVRAATAAFLPAVLFLSGCATPFRADVQRFQRLPAPSGQTFTVTSTDPGLAGGIEFSQYAELVSQQLIEEGYVPATSPGTADLVVSLDYEVDKGTERIVRDYDPFWGGGYGFGYGWGHGYYPYYGRHRYVFGYNDPFLWGGGYGGSSIRSYTVYQSEVSMTIDRAADNLRLFEGRAEARSRSDRLPYLVPNLVEAMFTDFPGNSGETVRITIAPEDKRAPDERDAVTD